METDLDKLKTLDVSGTWGIRHRQVLMLFICMAVAYSIRTGISVAVIAMVDTTNNATSIQIFDWDKKVQNYIFGSFYWGYVFMQIPAGQLSYKYGGKWFIGLALVINGIISFMIPLAAQKGGWVALCILRSIQGFSQGFIIPSTHTLLGRWVPTNERNRLGNFVFSGATLGTVLTMPASGYLSSTQYGWPSVFYAIGLISVGFGTLWLIFGADSPSSHKSIPFNERNLIETSLGQVGEIKFRSVPWRKIFSTVPFFATVTAHVGAVWGFFTVLNESPTFLKVKLGVNVTESGFLSAIPYLVSWFVLVFASSVADYLTNKNIISVTKLRKITNTIGTWGPAVMLITLTYIPANHFYLTMVIMVLVVSLDIINCLGFLMNYLDLSPIYAGMLVSVGNCLAVVLSNLGPIITGLILKDVSDVKQWQLVFMVPVSIYFFTNLIFIIFGKGEKQEWDSIKAEDVDDVDKEFIKKS